MRAVTRLILTAVILLLTGLLAAVAMYLPDFFFSFYTDFSRNVLTAISKVTGFFPFALWEVLLVLVVLIALYLLFRNGKFLTWLTGVMLFAGILVFLFTGLWGLNHFGPTIDQRLDMTVTPYSKDQVKAAAVYFGSQAGLWADQVERDEDGFMRSDFDGWAEIAEEGYTALARTEPFFQGSGAPVKKLLSGRLFSYMGFTGIFMTFTAECNVNPETYTVALPFTMCHELAHRLPVAAEDDANFCAFLACLENQDPDFQYSGWFSAFLYTYNALYRVDREAAQEIRAGLSETVRQDLTRNNEYYNQFDGQVQEVATKANDVYLKAFHEESGVRSYGEVADLLIAWYLDEIA